MSNIQILERDFGPKGRRRAKTGSFVGSVVILGVIGALAYGFGSAGGFAPQRWAIYGSVEVWVFLALGVVNTFSIALVAGVLSFAIGSVVALGQISESKFIRFLAVSYSEVLRSIPTLLLILFFYFGLPFLGVHIPAYWAVVAGSTAYNSAVLSNVFRAGIQSIDTGSIEAAYALGLRRAQVLRYVISKRAFFAMLPSIVSQLVLLVKDSALGFFVGYEEVLRRTQIIGSFSYNYVQSYIVSALIYIAICQLITVVARRLERSQARKFIVAGTFRDVPGL